MKAFKIVLITIASLVFICGVGYLYASSGIKSKPGYVDITESPIDAESTEFSLNVGPGGIKPLRWVYEIIAQNVDETDRTSREVFAQVLKELQGVQLRVYDSKDKQPLFDSAIAETTALLKQENWQTLITVRENQDNVEILQLLDQEQISGLSIMVSSPDKAVFLNLIGPFDIDAISDIFAKQEI